MTKRRVTRLPALPGPAAWNTILGDAPARPALDGRLTADVVVVGAGFAGLSAARRLMQLDPKARVVVVDALRVAEGSAGRNSGFMIDIPHDLVSEDYAGGGGDLDMMRLNRQAIGFAGEAVQDYGIDSNFFDRSGKINGAASAHADANNRSFARHLDSLGESSEVLDRRQMQEITGSAHYISGLYTPGTVMLQPAGYIRGLAGGLESQGVTILENSPVTAITRQGDAWELESPTGTLSAGRVILTVNGHLASFGFEARAIMQMFLYAVMTPELDADALAALGGRSRWGITPSDPMGTTVRRIDTGQGGNRIITRTCATLRPGTKVTAADLSRAARIMQRKFNQRFPQLRDMRQEHAWAGHLAMTLNGVSVMREIDTGLFAGCVQNGLGTARGTLTGIGAAELACGAQSDITRQFTAEPAPRALPPQPFQQIGANAIIRYREWRARDE